MFGAGKTVVKQPLSLRFKHDSQSVVFLCANTLVMVEMLARCFRIQYKKRSPVWKILREMARVSPAVSQTA